MTYILYRIHINPGHYWWFKGLDTKSCSTCPQVADMGCPLSVVVQIIIWKAWPWIIVGNMFEECYAPCTLKPSFVDSKEQENCSHYKRLNFSSLSFPIDRWRLLPPIPPSFVYIFVILLNLFLSNEGNIYSYTLSNKQSINHITYIFG